MSEPVEMIATWMPATPAMLADAGPLDASIEYLLSPTRHLTPRERITGWRRFTSRKGHTITMRVGWRARLYWLVHPVQNWRRHHPPVCDDDDL